MCNIKGKLGHKEFTGFKVVIKSTRGRYYSPVTGIEYKEGEFVEAPGRLKNKRMIAGNGFVDVFNPIQSCNNSLYKGYTAVFQFMKGARDLKRTTENCLREREKYCNSQFKRNIIIVKMTLKKELREGDYGNDSTVLGKFIKKIEEIK